MLGTKPTYATRLSTVLLAVAFIFGAVGPAIGTDFGNSCKDIIPLLPNDRHRGPAGNTGDTFCYQIDIVSPGALIVSVATPDFNRAEPKLRLSDSPETDVVAAERSAAYLAMRIRTPDTYFFEVASQDPRTALGEHTVVSRFVADMEAAAVELGDAQAPPETKEGEEIDPVLIVSPPLDGNSNKFRVQVRRPGLVLLPSGRRAVLVYEEQELRVRGSAERPQELLFYDLCRSGLSDDHDALFFPCASLVRPGERLRGEIVHDGADVFTFVLPELSTVRLVTRGGANTTGALYDQWGQRLAVPHNGGTDGNFQLVWTLAPGRYFVRISGHRGDQGLYSLIFAASPW